MNKNNHDQNSLVRYWNKWSLTHEELAKILGIKFDCSSSNGWAQFRSEGKWVLSILKGGRFLHVPRSNEINDKLREVGFKEVKDRGSGNRTSSLLYLATSTASSKSTERSLETPELSIVMPYNTPARDIVSLLCVIKIS